MPERRKIEKKEYIEKKEEHIQKPGLSRKKGQI